MIQIQIDTKQVQQIAGAIDPKQIKFAAAVALTKTAKQIQDSVRQSMPQKFTLRRQWVVKGIRITPASKTNLTAYVYSKDAFMERQEEGGIKTGTPGGGDFSSSSLPQSGGRRARPAMGRVAVPTDKVLRSKTDIIRKSDLPAGLGTKGFVINAGNGLSLLARRFAKGKRAGLQVLYVLKRSTSVKPRLGLKEIAHKVVTRRFTEIFSDAMQNAINTAWKK